MEAERTARILARLAATGGPEPGPSLLCAVSVEVTAVTGAGLTLITADAPQGPICCTDPVSALLEDLQYELGEGPCLDAHRMGRPVLEPDLAASAARRWAAFAPAAVDAGVRAIFGFPLQVDGMKLGALDLYRDRPGPLTDSEHADALAMAGIAARSLLAWQAQAPAGTLAAELRTGPDLHIVVHQAAGMASVQLGVSVADALAHLRAHAFGNERHLIDVARDIVDRRVRLDPATGDAHPA